MNKLIQINISKGGVPKRAIEEAYVTLLGIEGDVQKDKRYHGGPNRAICIFSIQLIEKLKSEGHPIEVGSTGENLSISFSAYDLLKPGIQIKIGKQVILEITSYAAPCKTIKQSFLNEVFIRISQKVFPNESRLYAKVLQEGKIVQGDNIELISNDAML